MLAKALVLTVLKEVSLGKRKVNMRCRQCHYSTHLLLLQ